MKKLILFSLLFTFSITVFAQTGKWKKALRKNSTESYKDFLSEYPNSEYSDEATLKLIDLEFKKVQFIGTETGYEFFLVKYGENTYSKQVMKNLCELRFNNAKWKNSLDSYKTFITKYPNCQLVNEAKEQIRIIEKKIRIIEEQNELAIAPIKNYSIGVTTEEQFFNDGWNTKNPFYRKLGIIGGNRIDDKLTIILGEYVGDDIPSSVGISHTATSGFTMRAYSTHSNLNDLAKGYQDLFDKFRSSNFTWEATKGQKIAELVFIKNILVVKQLFGQAAKGDCMKKIHVMHEDGQETITDAMSLSAKTRVNTELIYLNQGIFCVQDDDIKISKILFSKSLDKSKNLKSLTYTNNTGYKLKYVEIKFKISDNSSNILSEKILNLPYPVSNGDSKTIILTKQNIVISEKQSVIISVSDWDIYIEN